MMKFFKIITLFLLSIGSVYAGDKTGNGGDLVVCRDQNNAIISTELLDYYEGRTLRGISVADSSQLSLRNYVDTVLNKIVFYNQNLEKFKILEEGKLLVDAIEAFLSSGSSSDPEVLFLEEELVDIPDSKHLSFPENCKVEQFVINVDRQFPDDPKYIIQSNLLKASNLRTLKGIVLHEVLYKIYRDSNSKRARYANQLITSYEVDSFNFPQYVLLLKKLRRSNLNMKDGFFLTRRGVNNYNYAIAVDSDIELLNEDEFILVNTFQRSSSRSFNQIYGWGMKVVFDKNMKINLPLTMKHGTLNADFSRAETFDPNEEGILKRAYRYETQTSSIERVFINGNAQEFRFYGSQMLQFPFGSSEMIYDVSLNCRRVDRKKSDIAPQDSFYYTGFYLMPSSSRYYFSRYFSILNPKKVDLCKEQVKQSFNISIRLDDQENVVITQQ